MNGANPDTAVIDDLASVIDDLAEETQQELAGKLNEVMADMNKGVHDNSLVYYEVEMPVTGFKLYIRPVNYDHFNAKILSIYMFNLLPREVKRKPRPLQLAELEQILEDWGSQLDLDPKDRDKTKFSNKTLRGFYRSSEQIIQHLLLTGHISVGEDKYKKLRRQGIAGCKKKGIKSPSQKDVALWIVMNKAFDKSNPELSMFTIQEFIKHISFDIQFEDMAERIIEEVDLLKSMNNSVPEELNEQEEREETAQTEAESKAEES